MMLMNFINFTNVFEYLLLSLTTETAHVYSITNLLDVLCPKYCMGIYDKNTSKFYRNKPFSYTLSSFYLLAHKTEIQENYCVIRSAHIILIESRPAFAFDFAYVADKQGKTILRANATIFCST